MIPNHRNFAPKVFNFKIIFALIIFENLVASKVFTFTFCCAMPRKLPVGEIQHPDDEVKNVAVDCTVILWDRSHNGSLWVYTSTVINISPGSGNISTIIQSTKGKVFYLPGARTSPCAGQFPGARTLPKQRAIPRCTFIPARRRTLCRSHTTGL